MKTIAIDVCNFSISETEFKRTGIQEVIYKIFRAVIELRKQFPSTRFILLPYLPWYLPDAGEIEHPTPNSPRLLRQLESEFNYSSNELWGFDLAGEYGYAMNYEATIGVLKTVDFLHIQSLSSLQHLLSDFASRLPHLRGKISCTVYDLIPYLHPEYCTDGMALWYNRQYLPGIAQYVAHAVCISRHTAIDLSAYLSATSTARVHYLQLPLDPVTLSQRVASHEILKRMQDQSIPYVCHLGSIEPRKNFRNLIKGFNLFKKHNDSNLKLVFIGGTGWKNSEFFTLIDKANLKDEIISTGYIEDEREIASILANSKGLLMPSNYEGYGLPAAMGEMAGVPVLTSYVSSLPEAVNSTAIFINPTDPWSIATGIKCLTLRNSKKQVLSGEFTWLNYTRELLKALVQFAG